MNGTRFGAHASPRDLRRARLERQPHVQRGSTFQARAARELQIGEIEQQVVPLARQLAATLT